MNEETRLQISVIEHLDMIFPFRWPELCFEKDGVKVAPIYSNKNESKSKAHVQRLFNRMGRKSGVPDLFMPVPFGGFSGLYIELKTPKGRVSSKQLDLMTFLNQMGYYCLVCRSVESVVKAVEEYLEEYAQ